MEIIIFSITILYVANILWLVFGFYKVKQFEMTESIPKTKFSIVVPFRNEVENLPKLLYSISLLDYPKNLFEVILVDDASDEKLRITNYEFQIIDNVRKSNSPKKDAINTAILVAKNDWIITTDADCIVPKDWLLTLDAFIVKNNPKMIASSVAFCNKNNFLAGFQTMDMLSLQGTTMGSFGNNQAFMCNGANFCYQKEFFKTINGFEGNTDIASGDDVFLLQKAIKVAPNEVCFLKSEKTIVQTKTETTWCDLFQQRVRWASKTANYSSFYSKKLALSVLLMNLIWLVVVLGYFLELIQLDCFLVVVLTKIVADFTLIYPTSLFFKSRLYWYLLAGFVYPFFSVGVAFFSIFGKYTWKGREFSK